MKTHAGLAAAAALALGAGAAAAPVQAKKSLTLEGARRAIAAAQAEAKRLNAPGGVIAVVDEGGSLVALERLDGTFAAGANISIGKARTAALFRRPTRVFEETIKNGRTAMVALSDFTPLQGGVPITVEGRVVGAIGVSGAASAQQDEDLALAGVKALESPATAAAAAPVTYFDREAVAAAFGSGAVLFDGGASRDFMIHASRRGAAGMAEIHMDETDVIYVQEGSATFVTGGTVTGSREIGPGEIRGTSIEGGETRRLSRGDVIIVPRGTPHWFREVQGPLTYYVVKVR